MTDQGTHDIAQNVMVGSPARVNSFLRIVDRADVHITCHCGTVPKAGGLVQGT